MAKLLEIVQEINILLKTEQFADKRFQKGVFSDIAELIERKDGDIVQTFPAIVDNEGIITKLMIDDSKAFQLYHRHVGTSFDEIETEDDFGDRVSRQVTDNMLMVILADRNQIKLTKEEIITGVQLGMPLELGKTFRDTNSLESVEITPGVFELDRKAIWESEFTSVVFLKPNYIVMRFPYDVTTIAKKGCIMICN